MLARVRSSALVLTVLMTSSGCPGDEPAPAPRVREPERVEAPTPTPEPPVTPTPPVTPEPPPPTNPEVEQEFIERKAALANLGKLAFAALESGEFAALRKLTAIDEGPVRAACPDLVRGDPTELAAKFAFCHKAIDWSAIAEAQVFAGKPTGEPAEGCTIGIEDYGRLQLYLHMQSGKIWRVDFFGAVGADGKAFGIDGSLSCREVDEAPALQ